MTKQFWAGLCCAALLMVAAGCSRSGAPSDAMITADAQNRVRADQRIHSRGIQLNANHGVLTLTGMTESDAERMAAAEDASKVNGIKVLVNNLRVADASQMPETSDASAPSQAPAASPKETRARAVPVMNAPAVSHNPSKPSPAVAKSDSSSLPIVTDPSPSVGSKPSPAPAAVSTPSSNPNPAMNLPTGPGNPAVSSASMSTNPLPSMPPAIVPKKKVSIPYGTVLSVRMLETVSSDQNQPGDNFAASLVSPVMVDNNVVIPADAGLRGKVVEAENGGRFGGKPSLAIELNEVSYNGQTYTIATNQFSKQGSSRSTKAIGTIGGGAGVGAILGAIVGGGRGAAIGAAIGAGVGTGVQAKGKASEVKLPSESILSFRLKSPISVEPADTLLRSPNSTQDASADPFPNDRPVLKRRPGAGAADPEPPSRQPPSASTPDNSQAPVDSNDPNDQAPPVLKRRPN